NLQIPVMLTGATGVAAVMDSYSIFGGVQDALVQWWYGHNAVAFFLTTPILGIMYYFIPKAANRPVYSYRLSVIHFWSLVFIYIWAGPHHLLNTTLAPWLQYLGMLFSLMLWAPSWGGMLNGLLTLRSGWQQLMRDPVIKFFAAGVTFYGMATFEGPLLSIRAVNSLSHYSDWTIGHVHSGTLGWNGFMAAGMFYWLAPRLWKRSGGGDASARGMSCEGLWSVAWANMHFWLGMVGILLYVASMWVSGITQGLMLNAMDSESLLLQYPDFVETTQAILNPMLFRLIGGLLYLAGFIMLAINIGMTIWKAQPVNGTVTVAKELAGERKVSVFANMPMVFILAIMVSACMWLFGSDVVMLLGIFFTVLSTCLAVVHWQADSKAWTIWYEKVQENSIVFTVLTLIAVAIGGAIQIIPTLMVDPQANYEERIQVAYTPLELAGRDIYLREGCYNCHSQQIRTMVPDIMRYGRQGYHDDYSRLGESIYDHPFQWGSKRTGPDLAREGGPIAEGHQYMRIGKRGNDWHYNHMVNPRMNPGSIMPPYEWLVEQEWDLKNLPSRIAAMRKVGVPYAADFGPDDIEEAAFTQANEIVTDLEKKDIFVAPESEMVALIAYLQKLGAYRQVDPNNRVAVQFDAETLKQF
ncbi:MAG: cbb3-type cytochrome c oxidase subunit II, partial [Opitutales bacterium]